MKVIWIMSRPLLGTLGTPKQNHTGTWVDAAFESLKNNQDIEIHAICMARRCKEQVEKVGKHYVYKLPKELYCNVENLDIWYDMRRRIRPDLLMLWGSEQGVGLAPIKALKGVPRIVYMQGFLDNIVVNFNGGLSTIEILKSFSILDIFRLKWIPILRYRYKKRSESIESG